jgi:hypothetical protein
MLCRLLLHAVNLRHGTDGFTSPPKENPPPSVGFEPATECPVGPVASTLTTRPPKEYTHLSNLVCDFTQFVDANRPHSDSFRPNSVPQVCIKCDATLLEG